MTYHVQTEDKGLARPMILSLVYDRGTILASKRSSYDDLVAAGLDESVLAERLQRQHRLICAAVTAGRIEDLKKMTAKEAAAAADPLPVPLPSGSLSVSEPAVAQPYASWAERSETTPIPRPAFDHNFGNAMPGEPIIDVVGVIDEEIVPAEAVAVVSDMAGMERPSHDRLCIELLDRDRFKGGQARNVSIMVSRGTARKVVVGAEIMVKIIGSSFRPMIFHSITDPNGLARVTVQLPSFRAGRAAFLVRAISEGEEIELRRPIDHG